ncbi:50S ribosomal protein L25 [Patescibacteria group bacterium]|nr:50S ribosomal protein L25 [Patescibacteria group bacterium]
MTNTSEKIVFHVSTRHAKGSGNASRLRREGKTPGNIYGLNKKSVAVITDYQGVKKLYQSHGDTGLVYLQVDDDKKQIPVLIDEVSSVVIGEGILHVSFKRVSLSVKIEAEIPVVLIGETKIDDAVVSLVKDFVLVEALPADLLENFEVDISSLTEVGQSITLADLNFDKSKITLILGEDEETLDVMLVNVQAVKEEVEEVVEEIVEETLPEAEIDGKDKPEVEGEKTNDGDEKLPKKSVEEKASKK